MPFRARSTILILVPNEWQEEVMARIRITAEPLGPSGVSIVLDERVNRNNFDSDHFAAALVERIGWALADAEDLERDRPR
jgi:hypothetical protein